MLFWIHQPKNFEKLPKTEISKKEHKITFLGVALIIGSKTGKKIELRIKLFEQNIDDSHTFYEQILKFKLQSIEEARGGCASVCLCGCVFTPFVTKFWCLKK